MRTHLHNNIWRHLLTALLLAPVFGLEKSAQADLAMETETARLLEPGQFAFGTAFEFQTAFDGKEYAAPGFIEFGVLPHLEALIEPVAVVLIRPTPGPSATDFGDLETTLTYLVLEEKKYIPALAVAGEVKFPTSTNLLVGSGEYDYRFYGIASKRVGPVDIHANLGYNIIGSPPGVPTKNPFDYELGLEWFVDPRFDLFAEINRTDSAVGRSGKGAPPGGAIIKKETTPTAAVATPEVAPREVIGSVGIRVHASKQFDLYGSVSYDNSDAKLFRAGFAFKY